MTKKNIIRTTRHLGLDTTKSISWNVKHTIMEAHKKYHYNGYDAILEAERGALARWQQDKYRASPSTVRKLKAIFEALKRKRERYEKTYKM